MATAMRKTTAATAAWSGETFVLKTARLRASRIRALHGIQRMALGVPYGDEGRVNISTNPLTCLFDDTAEALAVNFVDPDTDIDGSAEFGDVDDDLAGLTIFTPRNVLDAGSFLNGYSVGIDEPFPTW